MPDDPFGLRIERLRNQVTAAYPAPALDLLLDAGGETRLVRVVSSRPLTTPHVVSCQQIRLSAIETEGNAPAFTPIGAAFPVVALGPTTTQLYVATRVRDLWVIGTSGSGCAATICVAVTGCCNAPVVGAAVTLTGPGGYSETGVTDSLGQFCKPYTTAGTYTATIAAAGHYTAGTGSRTFTGCLAQSIPVALTPATGYGCGRCGPLEDTLFLTIPSGTVTLVRGALGGFLNAWRGCSTFPAALSVTTDCCIPPPYTSAVTCLWEYVGCANAINYYFEACGGLGGKFPFLSVACSDITTLSRFWTCPPSGSYFSSFTNNTSFARSTSCSPFLQTGILQPAPLTVPGNTIFDGDPWTLSP